MHDMELVMEVLRQIEEATAKIDTRFQPIRQASDFRGHEEENSDSRLVKSSIVS